MGIFCNAEYLPQKCGAEGTYPHPWMGGWTIWHGGTPFWPKWPNWGRVKISKMRASSPASHLTQCQRHFSFHPSVDCFPTASLLFAPVTAPIRTAIPPISASSSLTREPFDPKSDSHIKDPILAQSSALPVFGMFFGASGFGVCKRFPTVVACAPMLQVSQAIFMTIIASLGLLLLARGVRNYIGESQGFPPKCCFPAFSVFSFTMISHRILMKSVQ